MSVNCDNYMVFNNWAIITIDPGVASNRNL